MGGWSELLDLLQPLDVIVSWGRSSHAPDVATLVVQEAIEGITGGPSHVRLYLGEGDFWEVTWPRCRYGRLAELDLRTTDLEVGRHALLGQASEEQRRRILLTADKLVGSPYDWQELFEHLLDEAGLDHEDDSDPQRFVCSSGVEHCFRAGGLGFRPEIQLVSPQDILESPHWQVCWRWGKSPLRS